MGTFFKSCGFGVVVIGAPKGGCTCIWFCGCPVFCLYTMHFMLYFYARVCMDGSNKASTRVVCALQGALCIASTSIQVSVQCNVCMLQKTLLWLQMCYRLQQTTQGHPNNDQ